MGSATRRSRASSSPSDCDGHADAADVGLYGVTVRRMRHQRRFWPPDTVSPGVTAAYVDGPALRTSTTDAADAHWRDVHAPLALRHHPGMWHYHQISVNDVLAGPALDGVALSAAFRVSPGDVGAILR